MKSIENNVFWITGASSGIGRSMAELVIEHGAKVIVSGRNLAALENFLSKFPNHQNNILPMAFDLGADFDAEDLAKQAVNRFGRIDFLINNGGISQRSQTAETPIEVDRKIMETNFFGNIKLTKAVLPIMIQQGGGHIAVTSSVVGKFGFPLRSAYAASKHALHGFYESLRAENYEQNIRVTMIIPGRINTDISVNAMTAEGKKHGVLDPGQATGMTSEKAAQLILKGILNQRKEIIVGKFDTIMVHIRRFFPRLFYYMARKIDPK